MHAVNLPKTYIRVPPRSHRSNLRQAVWLFRGTVLSPFYWVLASLYRVPGLAFRRKCVNLALQLIFFPKAQRSLQRAARFLLYPMDSTRYFEFDYADRSLASIPMKRYLDVSSPRQVPVLLVRGRPELSADLINPDRKDLIRTREIVFAAGLGSRCSVHESLIADAPFAPASFDVVTCISVLEHIPTDTEALRKMWDLLKPGGTLVLTVPCMARGCDQYIDYDEYELLERDADGFVFWQRFYDSKLLRERIFSVLGQPSDVKIYGEKVAGSFASDAERKRCGQGFPFWREPYMMAREYRYFDSIEDLPGEGVIGMTFMKK